MGRGEPQGSGGFIRRLEFPSIEPMLGNYDARYCMDTRSINIALIRAVCEVAQGAIGPNAMNKLFSGTGVVTSDGLTLLKEMRFRASQPVVKLLLSALEVQDKEAGDGTTRMLLLVGSMLEEAERLIKSRVHPSRVVAGFSEAASETVRFLEGISKKVLGMRDLIDVATTAGAGKHLAESRPVLVSDVVDGVCAVTEVRSGRRVVDREALAVEAIEGSSSTESFLLKGTLIHGRRAHPEMPQRIEEARLGIVDFPLDLFNKPAYASKIPHVKVVSVAGVSDFWDFQRARDLLEERVEAITRCGADVVVCKRGIGDLGISMLAKRGLLAIERVTRELDIFRLSKATGAKVVGDPITLLENDLGSARLVEEREVAGRRAIFFEGCKSPKAVTLVIHGVNASSLGTHRRCAETIIGAVASAVEADSILPGGGAAEAAASRFLRGRAFDFSSKKQLIYQGFADALMIVPSTLAKTTGADFIQLIADLLNSQEMGHVFGIDVKSRRVANVYELGIVDPLRVVSGAISNASDFVTQLLDIDCLLKAKPTRAEEEGEEHNHHGGMTEAAKGDDVSSK